MKSTWVFLMDLLYGFMFGIGIACAVSALHPSLTGRQEFGLILGGFCCYRALTFAMHDG